MSRTRGGCRRIATRTTATGVLAAAVLCGATAAKAQAVAPFEVHEGGIPAPLAGSPGDPGRGRDIALDPQRGNCLICHTVPDAPGEPFQGDIGPPLAGVGARLSPARLRLRVVDGTLINPGTVMPAYHRVQGLHRVASEWRGRPVLSAAEVEDVVTWLLTLDTAP